MRDQGSKRRRWTACLKAMLLAPMLLATGHASAQDEANDPWESFNRAIFEFNRGLDTAIVRPAAEAYRFVLPWPIRDGIRNLLNNARTPVILANDLMQGEWKRAGETFQRFAANSLLGVGGIFDVASYTGLADFHSEDFGQTLGVWHVGEGPYLVLPIIGPAPPRDAAGIVVDVFLDPYTYYLRNIHKEYVGAARFVVYAVELRSRNIETLDEIERG